MIENPMYLKLREAYLLLNAMIYRESPNYVLLIEFPLFKFDHDFVTLSLFSLGTNLYTRCVNSQNSRCLLIRVIIINRATGSSK